MVLVLLLRVVDQGAARSCVVVLKDLLVVLIAAGLGYCHGPTTAIRVNCLLLLPEPAMRRSA